MRRPPVIGDRFAVGRTVLRRRPETEVRERRHRGRIRTRPVGMHTTLRGKYPSTILLLTIIIIIIVIIRSTGKSFEIRSHGDDGQTIVTIFFFFICDATRIFIR